MNSRRLFITRSMFSRWIESQRAGVVESMPAVEEFLIGCCDKKRIRLCK